MSSATSDILASSNAANQPSTAQLVSQVEALTRIVESSVVHPSSVLLLIRYFCLILDTVSAPEFYTKWVKLPNVDDPVLPEIANNPKWFPYFKDAISAARVSELAQ
ncbi:hypothetical protein B0H14DRAFT_3713250 [Mycena olivaceomarginata]|nr:hypothetical protein B0H14DRAFT_3713250 [Mycena olivaceomarginata]